MKTIYDLKLHETLALDKIEVTRVPGGWLYRINWLNQSTFVPFVREFDRTEVPPMPKAPPPAPKGRQPHAPVGSINWWRWLRN
jgi:hypothetical protein